MKNQYSQCTQYPEAYSKDNSQYCYYMDDGTLVRLTAGKDGVTEDWIARLKADHVEEMNMLRRGRSKGEGKNKLLSLAMFEDEANDKSDVLIDPTADVEENYIAEVERAERCEAIRRAMMALSLEQRELLICVRVKKVSIISIARKAGVTEGAIRDRLRKAERKLLKSICRGYGLTIPGAGICRG